MCFMVQVIFAMDDLGCYVTIWGQDDKCCLYYQKGASIQNFWDKTFILMNNVLSLVL